MKKPNILWYLAMFTTFKHPYAVAYGFQPPTTSKLGVGDSNGSVNSLDGFQRTDEYNPEDAQWGATIDSLWYAWCAIAPISTLILQLNIALMPLIGHILLRCIVIVTVFFSTASVASATLFVSFAKNLKSKKERWIEASGHPRETRSVDFWTTLSLPLTFLMWSVAFSLVTTILLAWVAPGQQPSRKSVQVGISSGIIVTAALLVSAGLYRIVVFVR